MTSNALPSAVTNHPGFEALPGTAVGWIGPYTFWMDTVDDLPDVPVMRIHAGMIDGLIDEASINPEHAEKFLHMIFSDQETI